MVVDFKLQPRPVAVSGCNVLSIVGRSQRENKTFSPDRFEVAFLHAGALFRLALVALTDGATGTSHCERDHGV